MRHCCLLVVLLPAMAWSSPAEEFWNRLQALCGQAFAGELLQHPPGENEMAGQLLIAHVRDCSDEEIRIPFHVGADRSRVWVLTRDEGRLTLLHEHTHADGSADEVTGYGGTASNVGRAGQQLFPASEATRRMIEPAFANVWSLEVEPGERLRYGLKRLGTDREYLIEFDFGRVLPEPPPPWGDSSHE